jgi:hypothetical protein
MILVRGMLGRVNSTAEALVHSFVETGCVNCNHFLEYLMQFLLLQIWHTTMLNRKLIMSSQTVRILNLDTSMLPNFKGYCPGIRL